MTTFQNVTLKIETTVTHKICETTFSCEFSCTMFIGNNPTWFHFWWKKNLVKHRKVSKYYETDCLQNFLFLFMFLLTAKLVENSHIYARILFIFVNNVLKQTLNFFSTTFPPQWKHRKSSYQVGHILGLLCHLIALILG